MFSQFGFAILMQLDRELDDKKARLVASEESVTKIKQELTPVEVRWHPQMFVLSPNYMLFILGQFHMRNGTTANLKNKQILVNLDVLFRQITKF